jgi:DNA-binding winged helix-turn-helix (wHTH) protein
VLDVALETFAGLAGTVLLLEIVFAEITAGLEARHVVRALATEQGTENDQERQESLHDLLLEEQPPARGRLRRLGLRKESGDVFRVECGFGGVSLREAVKFSFEGCVLDLDTREVFKNDRSVALSPKAFALFELLSALVLARPKALSKAEIHQALWPDTFVTETNLANLVVELRAALGDEAHASKIIRTVPRFGYAFCAEAHAEARRVADVAAEGGVEYRLVWGRREVALLPGENLIGRDHAAVAWINDESVSRRHARIVVDASGAHLEDLASKNGTFLRGKPVDRPTRLEDGDEITLGEVVAPIRFHTFGAAATTRTATRKGPKADGD